METDIEGVIRDPYFLGREADLFPARRDDLIEMWHRRREDGLWLVLLMDAIGSGKTYFTACCLYLMVLELLSYESPQEHFALPDARISVICMSRDAGKAKEVTFTQVLPFFVPKDGRANFFTDYFPPNINPEKYWDGAFRFPSKLSFPKDVVIFPGTGSEASALGFSLYGGVIDEANFMPVTRKSKKARGKMVYDAAEEIFDSIKSRMDSRFRKDLGDGTGIRQHGLLVVISSVNYNMDFLTRKILSQMDNRQVMCRWRADWEAKPLVHQGKRIYTGATVPFCLDTLEILDESTIVEDVGSYRLPDGIEGLHDALEEDDDGEDSKAVSTGKISAGEV